MRFLKLPFLYRRCEFWAGYGTVQVGGAISTHQTPCVHACQLHLKPWPMGSVRTCNNKEVKNTTQSVPLNTSLCHNFSHHCFILCTQSPLTCTSPLLHNKEYFNLLNAVHMGISLLITSDFKCQSMTHAYYIRVNILITSVLALLYL